jgi:hypothetical protein
MHLRRVRLAIGLVAVLLPLQSQAADVASWDFWIQQGDAIYHAPSFVKLKREPFIIRFRGATGNSYAFAATVDESEMPAPGDLGKLFRAGNGLLVDKPNNKITVSGSGVMAKGWSSWNMWAYHSPAEPQFISGFQQRTPNPDGSVLLERKIDLMCTDSGSKDLCNTVAQVPYGKFYAMITTMPDLAPGQKIEDTRWLSPKRLTVEFE